jgi:arsenate reductase (thioredoxin)
VSEPKSDSSWSGARPHRTDASKEPPDDSPATLRVLFVCVENSNRSQMAEAFARMHAREFARGYRELRLEAFSAGSKPSGRINPKAIASMRELGYDLSAHASKSLDDLPAVPFDAAITMGCGDACPTVRARTREEWNIPDPKDLAPEEFTKVRDMIGAKVVDLLNRLRIREDRGA